MENQKLDYLTDGEIDLKVYFKTSSSFRGYPPSYYYKVYLHETKEEIGTAGIRLGDIKNNRYLGNIEYDINENYRGHYYASKAVSLLKEVAIQNNIYNITITCSKKNIASLKTAEHAGATFVKEVKVPWRYVLQKNGVARNLFIYNLETKETGKRR